MHSALSDTTQRSGKWRTLPSDSAEVKVIATSSNSNNSSTNSLSSFRSSSALSVSVPNSPQNARSQIADGVLTKKYVLTELKRIE